MRSISIHPTFWSAVHNRICYAVVGFLAALSLALSCAPATNKNKIKPGGSTSTDTDSSGAETASATPDNDPNGGILEIYNSASPPEVVPPNKTSTIPSAVDCRQECVASNDCDGLDDSGRSLYPDPQVCHDECSDLCAGETIETDDSALPTFVIPGGYVCKDFTVAACTTHQDILQVGETLSFQHYDSPSSMNLDGREIAQGNHWQKVFNSPWVGANPACPEELRNKAIVRTKSGSRERKINWNGPHTTGFPLVRANGSEHGLIDPDEVAPGSLMLAPIDGVRGSGGYMRVLYYDNDPIGEPDDEDNPAQIDSRIHYTGHTDSICRYNVIAVLGCGYDCHVSQKFFRECAQRPKPSPWEVDFRVCYYPN